MSSCCLETIILHPSLVRDPGKSLSRTTLACADKCQKFPVRTSHHDSSHREHSLFVRRTSAPPQRRGGEDKPRRPWSEGDRETRVGPYSCELERPRSSWERRLPAGPGDEVPLKTRSVHAWAAPTSRLQASAPSSNSFVDELPHRLRRGLKPTRAGWKPALPARYARWRSPLGTWGLSEGAGDRLRPCRCRESGIGS